MPILTARPLTALGWGSAVVLAVAGPTGCADGVPAQVSYAVLQVETTDEARQTYNSTQAARDLAATLDSAA